MLTWPSLPRKIPDYMATGLASDKELSSHNKLTVDDVTVDVDVERLSINMCRNMFPRWISLRSESFPKIGKRYENQFDIFSLT